MNAKKTILKAADALKLAKGSQEIYAAKGKKVHHFDLKRNKPTQEELLKNLLGPTGNLRAPTLRVGKTLVVGFDEEIYRKVLG